MEKIKWFSSKLKKDTLTTQLQTTVLAASLVFSSAINAQSTEWNWKTITFSQNWETFMVLQSIIEEHRILVDEILENQFMDSDERQKWLTAIPKLKDYEVQVLTQILKQERSNSKKFNGNIKNSLIEKDDWLRDLTLEERLKFLWASDTEDYWQWDTFFDNRESIINSIASASEKMRWNDFWKRYNITNDNFNLKQYTNFVLPNLALWHRNKSDQLDKIFLTMDSLLAYKSIKLALEMWDKSTIGVLAYYINKHHLKMYDGMTEKDKKERLILVTKYSTIMSRYMPEYYSEILKWASWDIAIDIFNIWDERAASLYMENLAQSEIHSYNIRKVQEQYPEKLAEFTRNCTTNQTDCLRESLAFGWLDLLAGYLKPNPVYWREDIETWEMIVHYWETIFAKAHQEWLITDDENKIIHDLFLKVAQEVESKTWIVHVVKKNSEINNYTKVPLAQKIGNPWYGSYNHSDSYSSSGFNWWFAIDVADVIVWSLAPKSRLNMALKSIDIATTVAAPQSTPAKLVVKQIAKRSLKYFIQKMRK